MIAAHPKYDPTFSLDESRGFISGETGPDKTYPKILQLATGPLKLFARFVRPVKNDHMTSAPGRSVNRFLIYHLMVIVG